MISRFVFTIILIFLAYIWLIPKLSQVFAQSYKFELANPATTINTGSTFDVKVLINTVGQESISGDVLFLFEPAKIKVNSAQNGGFFTQFNETPLSGTTNKYMLNAFEENIARPKSTTSDKLFATMSLTALSAGTTQLTFECTQGTEDTNIISWPNYADIVNCPLNPLSLNIGSGAGTPQPSNPPQPTNPPPPTNPPVPTNPPAPTIDPATFTPTPTRVPTSTPLPTNTPRPTVAELPKAGSVNVTFAALSIGSLLTVVGLLFML